MTTFAAAFLLICATAGRSEVPPLLNYQGRLTNNAGEPVNGAVSLTFTIYADPAGTLPLWSEDQPNVEVAAGLFQAILGSVFPIPDTVFNGEVRWLGIRLGADPLVEALMPIVSVAYAYRSFHAMEAQEAQLAHGVAPNTVGTIQIVDSSILLEDISRNGATDGQVIKHLSGHWVPSTDEIGGGAGWIDAGTIVRLDGTDDSVGIGTTSPRCKLDVAGQAIFGANTTVNDGLSAMGGGINNSADSISVVSGGENNSAIGAHSAVGGGFVNMASGMQSSVGGGNANYASGINSTVMGGIRNTASAFGAAVLGGKNNVAGGQFSVVAGGGGAATDIDTSNMAGGDYSFVGGGHTNHATGYSSVASGGHQNQAAGDRSTVSGGFANEAEGSESTIGGGQHNFAGGAQSTVAGGESDSAEGWRSFVGGGHRNQAAGDRSTVSGGFANEAEGAESTVGGGQHNLAGGAQSTVAGGEADSAVGWWSFVGGGYNNRAGAAEGDAGAVVCGGIGNYAWADETFVGGGDSNTAISQRSVIVGGRKNVVDTTSSYSGIGAGYYNWVVGEYSVIAGGISNYASGHGATIGGGGTTLWGWFPGGGNRAIGDFSTIGGGQENSAAILGVVSGGGWNKADGFSAGICGGYSNQAGVNADDTAAFVGGGFDNHAEEKFASVLGGRNNKAAGSYSSVSGGKDNFNLGGYCTIPGGESDTIGIWATHSMAFGKGVMVNTAYRVVYFEGTNSGRLGINRDDIDGGIGYPIHVGTNTGNGNGAHLTAGGAWTNGSSRSFKEDFQRLDARELLDRISRMPIESWRYKGSGERHIGPISEDFVSAFNVGTVDEKGNRDTEYLSSGDVAGVALAGVQQLMKENRELKALVAELMERVGILEGANSK